GAAVDAVVATVKILEVCPLFNAGYGAVFTEDGVHELDAAVMEGHTLNAGAIAGARRIRNPILAAHALMRVGKSVFLAGEGADRFASRQGLQPVAADYFSTERRRDQLRELQTMKPHSRELDDNAMGTVGILP
ncbi:MAG: isoaspartyl peptidase/L-asparaginase, partial [bacterium]|nr:isoaspartyl peptidase/L-asparaginase [bacterium]